ncbi:MAG: rRNA pseudouridine synthase [Deltaproteobacteria bacterium]|nr:rRNA pseudouridine synthase [Deltaproteobacteria bacterium]
MVLIRLQKFLSMAGCCSRRHGEKHITDGLVKVNGKVVNELGTKVDPEKDRVEINGKPVAIKQDMVYIALNKPMGYVTSCNQPGDKIVLDLIDISGRVYPVGRLDKDSTGLLLLTNDGELHHRLSHPSFDHEKEYEVTVAKPLTDKALLNMAQGMPIMGTKTRPAEIKRISLKQFRIVLKEGKNRQIRRMAGKTGNGVIQLNRIRIANIKLGRLARGKWRYLTEKEKDALLKGIRFGGRHTLRSGAKSINLILIDWRRCKNHRQYISP